MGIRFAPSPTGRLHIGNLRTAWISHQIARLLGEPWIVRFEDIDQPRNKPGAREQQMDDMAVLGMVAQRYSIQSRSRERHWAVFESARLAGQIYPCSCSRKEVQKALSELASAPHAEAPQYHGACRNRYRPPKSAGATIGWRFKDPDPSGAHDTLIARTASITDQGILPDPETFVPAYHFACAIDDFDGRFRALVRAIDLKTALRPQRTIQIWLAQVEGASEWRPPCVFHTALVTAEDGSRLEKRTLGITLPEILSRGWTPAEIVNRFAATFHCPTPALFLPGQEISENPVSITVSQIFSLP